MTDNAKTNKAYASRELYAANLIMKRRIWDACRNDKRVITTGRKLNLVSN